MEKKNKEEVNKEAYSKSKNKNSDSLKKERPVQAQENQMLKCNVFQRHSNQSRSNANKSNNETSNTLENAQPQQKPQNNSQEKISDDSVKVDPSKSNNKNSNSTEKRKKKNSKAKKSDKTPFRKPTSYKNAKLERQFNAEAFTFDDLINNSAVMKLIEDLVSNFVCNSNLPEKDLQLLKESLIQRTCYAFVNILNSYLAKTLARVLNTDIFQEITKKAVEKKDADCQTYFPIPPEDTKK